MLQAYLASLNIRQPFGAGMAGVAMEEGQTEISQGSSEEQTTDIFEICRSRSEHKNWFEMTVNL